MAIFGSINNGEARYVDGLLYGSLKAIDRFSKSDNFCGNPPDRIDQSHILWDGGLLYQNQLTQMRMWILGSEALG
jgi:hypothetical protein